MERRRITNLKKKIVLLLAAGITLGAAKTTSKQITLLKEIRKEWRLINKDALRKSLTSLYESKVISLNPKGGEFEIILSQEGKKLAARFDLENLKIKDQKNWDGKWRIILFDIPEKLKKVREAIRFHFRDIGLMEYQKSVFISPYPCEKELKFIAEFYKARKYIRFIVAEAIDNEEDYKKKFGIT